MFRLGLEWHALGGDDVGDATRRGTLVAYYEARGALDELAEVMVDLGKDPVHRAGRKVSRLRQDELNLLQKVWNAWVGGLLDHGLHQEVKRALGLTPQPEDVVKPWGALVERPGETGQVPLPDGAHITAAFDQAQGRLLIRGAAGAGKTTLLLELTRDLIARARRDESHPLPLVFSLASWADGLQPFGDWLADEMNLRYDVPYTTALKWIASGRILPLLDGFDEVRDEVRAACLAAILALDEAGGGRPLVMCSRGVEYEAAAQALGRRWEQAWALELQPLRPEPVEGYLAGLGDAVAGLREALAQDEGLRELTDTPLMLSLLILTYHDQKARRIPDAPRGASSHSAGGEGVPRRYLAGYVARMMERGAGQPSREQILAPLAWLARTMNQRGETVFYVENLEPGWPVEGDVGRQTTWLVRVAVGLVFGLLILFGLTTPPGGLGAGLLSSVLGGALFGWMFGGVDAKTSQTAERAVNWSWGRLLLGLTVGVGLSWVIAPVVGPIFRAGRSTGHEAIIAAMVGGLAGAVGGALNGRRIGVRSYPNQGTWRVALHALGVGVVSALVFGLGFGLVMQVGEGLGVEPRWGLFAGLLFGLCLALGLGGVVALRHFTLRLLLSQAGLLPWRLVPLLDDAVDHLLLRKVGGGYVFVHRWLQDYFASK